MELRPTPESRSKRAGPTPAQPQHALITTSPVHILELRQNNPQDCSNLITALVDRATVEISRTIIALNATFSQQLQQASISASNGIKAAQNSASQTIAIVMQNASVATSSAFASVTVANRAVTSANFALSSASSQILSVSLDLTSVSSASSSEVLRLSSSLSLAQANILSVQASASSAIIAAQSALASLSVSGALAAASASSILASAISGAQSSPTGQASPSFSFPSPNFSTSLSPTQIAGIVVGAVFAAIVLTSVICFVFIRRSKRRRQDSYLDEKSGSRSPEILSSQSRFSSALRTGNSIKITSQKSKARWPRASSAASSKATDASKERETSTAVESVSDDANDSAKDFKPTFTVAASGLDNRSETTLVTQPIQEEFWPRQEARDERAPNMTLVVSPGIAISKRWLTTSNGKPVNKPIEEPIVRQKSFEPPRFPQETPKEVPGQSRRVIVERRAFKELRVVKALEPETTTEDELEDSAEDPFQDPVAEQTKEVVQEPLSVPKMELLDFEPFEKLLEDPFEDPIVEPVKESIEDLPKVPSKDSMQRFDFAIDEGALEDPVEDSARGTNTSELIEEPVEEAPKAPSKARDSAGLFDFRIVEEAFEDPFEDPVAETMEDVPKAPSKDSMQRFDFQITEGTVKDQFEDTESGQEPVEEPVEEFVEEFVEGFVEEEAKAPSKDSVQRFDFQILEEALQDAFEDPVAEPIKSPVQIPVDELIEEASIEEPMYVSADVESLELPGSQGNETEFSLGQLDDTLVEEEEQEEDEPEALAVYAMEPASAPGPATDEVDTPLRYSMGSEIDEMIREVSKQSENVVDAPSSLRDSFARTAMSPPLSASSSPSPPASRSPSPVREASPVKEASPERDDAKARALQLAEVRERTLSPLRRNPVFIFDIEDADPLPPRPIVGERVEFSPPRQNPPSEENGTLLEEDQEDDSSDEEPEEEAEEVDDRATRGRSMIRTSDIIQARLSTLAQMKREQEQLEEETGTEDEEATTPVAIVISSPTADKPMPVRTSNLSPLRRNPVDYPEAVPSTTPTPFRPQKSSPLPTSSLLRPIPTATAALSRDNSPLRRNPPAGLYVSNPLANDVKSNPPAKAAAPFRASNSQFSEALSRFRDLDAKNPQEAAIASSEVTSRAIAGIYIPSSLREQAIRNLSKSRERSRPRAAMRTQSTTRRQA